VIGKTRVVSSKTWHNAQCVAVEWRRRVRTGGAVRSNAVSNALRVRTYDGKHNVTINVGTSRRPANGQSIPASRHSTGRTLVQA